MHVSSTQENLGETANIHVSTRALAASKQLEHPPDRGFKAIQCHLRADMKVLENAQGCHGGLLTTRKQPSSKVSAWDRQPNDQHGSLTRNVEAPRIEVNTRRGTVCFAKHESHNENTPKRGNYNNPNKYVWCSGFCLAERTPQLAICRVLATSTSTLRAYRLSTSKQGCVYER